MCLALPKKKGLLEGKKQTKMQIREEQGGTGATLSKMTTGPSDSFPSRYQSKWEMARTLLSESWWEENAWCSRALTRPWDHPWNPPHSWQHFSGAANMFMRLNTAETLGYQKWPQETVMAGPTLCGKTRHLCSSWWQLLSFHLLFSQFYVLSSFLLLSKHFISQRTQVKSGCHFHHIPSYACIGKCPTSLSVSSWHFP